MTKQEAIRICVMQGLHGESMVSAMIALGVLKVEEPTPPATINMPIVRAHRPGNSEWRTSDMMAEVRLDTAIETLRMAGYRVEIRKPSA